MPHSLNIILYNLRDSGIVYLVCIFAIVGAAKFLANRPQPKKFTLFGAFLILGAGLGGAVVNAIMYQVMVGVSTPTNFNDLKNYADTLNTFNLISGVLHFLIGAAYAGGIACLVWAIFSDKLKVTAKKTKKKPARRRDDDDDDEEDDDEDDRPRRKRRSRRDDDDEDEDD